jgi:hypothetical protein
MYFGGLLVRLSVGAGKPQFASIRFLHQSDFYNDHRIRTLHPWFDMIYQIISDLFKGLKQFLGPLLRLAEDIGSRLVSMGIE